MNRVAKVAVVLTLALVPGVAQTQDLPESSPKALMHHAQGVEAYVAARNAEAIKHFRLAYESDPTSYVSLMMAGVAAGNAGQLALADSFYAMVVPHQEKLSAYYRYRLEAMIAGRAGNIDAVIAANRKAAELGGGTKAWYNIAQAGGPRGMAREAIDALRRLDPDKEPMKGWSAYFTVYTAAAHQLGDYEDELAMARRARAADPNGVLGAQLEAEALVALGRSAEAEKVLGEIARMTPAGNLTPGEAMTTVAQEFDAHGNPRAAKLWLESALKWFATLDSTSAKTTDNRFDKAYALYSLGRYREAAAIVDSLATEFPNTGAWKAWTGYLAALTGDKARAAEVSTKLAAGEFQIAAGNRSIWRALIALALNDRTTALAHFQESGLRARWMHRDPVVMKAMKGNAGWTAYLRASD